MGSFLLSCSESSEEYQNGELVGYNIGGFIDIHSSDEDHASWFMTIKLLDIENYKLLLKTCTKAELMDNVYFVLARKKGIMDDLRTCTLEFRNKKEEKK